METFRLLLEHLAWMQSGREDTSVLNLEEMPQKHMECFRLLFDHRAWIEYQFLSGIRDSRKARSLWRMMRGVGRVSKSIHQSWLANGIGLGLLCFKGVQEEIPWEEASTLQIGSVAFPPGQCTSPDFHRAFQKLLERYNKCIATGNYFERDLSFICVLSIKVPIEKKVWKLI